MADLTDAQWQPIDAEIFAGHKIAAIKLHREATGSELRDAKDAVESRETMLRESQPARFVAGAKTGCMSVLLLVAGALLITRIFA